MSAWDQNACIYPTSPACAVIEEVAGTWLLDVLGLPADASVAFVTGTQSAHLTALAVARSHLLAARGHDVEQHGLHGAPPLRVLAAGRTTPPSIAPCACSGSASTRSSWCRPTATGGSTRPRSQPRSTSGRRWSASAAGDLNAGAFDDFDACIDAAHARGAWVHVDGAFGLWAAASPRLRHLMAGAARADSWATDAHKWLNAPFDCGIVATAHADRHRATMAIRASYMTEHAERTSMDWNPEWSRRARAVPVYAALRSLGRDGIAELVERCSALCVRLVEGIGALDGAEVVVGAGDQPGARPVRRRRPHGCDGRGAAGRGHVVVRRGDVERRACDARVGVQLAHLGGRRRPHRRGGRARPPEHALIALEDDADHAPGR